ncbi:MAG: hypothetical protein KA031_03175, partial [Candidatus Hydrogenedentes bacterium]|nr:hypothetical protein [Candidatus Hydrogenedentota bacterium]
GSWLGRFFVSLLYALKRRCILARINTLFFLQSIAEVKDLKDYMGMLNLAEKVLGPPLRAYLGLLSSIDDKMKEKTGTGLFDIIVAQEEKQEKFRKEHPVLNTGKQLLKGTLKGLIGAGFYDSK